MNALFLLIFSTASLKPDRCRFIRHCYIMPSDSGDVERLFCLFHALEYRNNWNVWDAIDSRNENPEKSIPIFPPKPLPIAGNIR